MIMHALHFKTSLFVKKHDTQEKYRKK